MNKDGIITGAWIMCAAIITVATVNSIQRITQACIKSLEKK
jgi:hypothetical protein